MTVHQTRHTWLKPVVTDCRPRGQTQAEKPHQSDAARQQPQHMSGTGSQPDRPSGQDERPVSRKSEVTLGQTGLFIGASGRVVDQTGKLYFPLYLSVLSSSPSVTFTSAGLSF